MRGASEDSTKLKAARRGSPQRGQRVIVFWPTGSASYSLAPGSRLTVGRADDCDVQIPDASMSRRHVVLHGGPPHRIEDLGSANGTYLGEHRLQPNTPTRLPESAVAELGDALLVVRSFEDAEAAATASSRSPEALGAPMERVRELIRMVAPTTVSVLLLGETGVGKGLVAQTIHESSPRRDHPYLRLNCAALAETLLESELFGHERGAFTGATANKPGLLEAASGGTVLLDEVGDLAPSTQAKLLHVLEHNEVLRVGAVRPRPIDVRFLAATNRDLETLVTEGRFRQDLWFRLNGLTIRLPPLRERPAEIAALSRSFVEEACARMGRPPAPITEATANLLAAHPWPGNVRELRNVLVRAVLFANGGPIKHAHLDFAAATPRPKAPNATLRTEVRALEKQRIVEALARCGNNQVEAARALGISRTTLRLRMKELDLLEAARRK